MRTIWIDRVGVERFLEDADALSGSLVVFRNGPGTVNGVKAIPFVDAARLAEATALLRLCGDVARDTPEFIDRVEAFLSRSPAQPAAPRVQTNAERYPEAFRQPAAPEPSAECKYGGSFCGDTSCPTHGQDRAEKAEAALRLLGDWANPLLRRAESAEATLAAVRERVEKAVELLEDVNRYERADDFAQTILEALRG